MFAACAHQGKEVAVDVKLLPEGTVVFEDVSIERYEGYVTQALPKAVSKAGVSACLHLILASFLLYLAGLAG